MASVNLVGLDIGATSIRGVETTHAKDGPTMLGAGQVALPPGAVQSGNVQDEKAVTAAVKHLWHQAKFRSRSVVLGVTSPQVVVREMSVANLPEKELRKSLPFQVRDALPLPVERSLLDFYPLEDPGRNETVRGLLIAAPKEPVLNAVRAVEKAGLHVAKVDLATFALLRSLAELNGEVEAVVDIGAQITSLIVHLDGEPLIVRTVPRGGAEITSAIAKRLSIDVQEAERIKCDHGIRPDTGEWDERADAIRDAVRPLVSELRSSFAYLTSGERQRWVTRLWLSGGGATLPGLVESLTEQLSVEVVIADPVSRVRPGRRLRPENFSGFHTSAAVSIGLTLGAA
ncbi:pilus assembly protein PilM [Virgisporangium aliadipatigenens]|uniref:Pilus assembly protein PilM n=1 Tax=Virgisporangium aliadipatigenens TaxID=741659 RepID=A0A8J3YS79_9ACTN|nr:type IV pilus assembly protein PilM [Virgisporangium aliadipatigenens]GIJ50899.1 pilus assembly protein PilM [Virgisporangium aliadipatigenens]